jgi:hypothetical protein
MAVPVAAGKIVLDTNVFIGYLRAGLYADWVCSYGNNPSCIHRRRALICRGRFIRSRSIVALPTAERPTISARSASTAKCNAHVSRRG